ncbi:hypothetical protein L915_00208 [Phytophthora nicotianae]|uniref:Uncharacterized protein n=1 Tax=Phytophthora nicotianae TaxID=4792 RepID=W2JXQ0_PHYNI|nr:hypothetical protein L915_00208 [Phytophthora nicotianae]ETL50572.1 hypothetical protein L916_00210 [Phytophthora nicotianae]
MRGTCAQESKGTEVTRTDRAIKCRRWRGCIVPSCCGTSPIQSAAAELRTLESNMGVFTPHFNLPVQ